MRYSLPKILLTFTLTVLIALAFGCGGSGGTAKSTSATVGAGGGVIESADGGLRLTIPAGALAADTTISITSLSLSDLPAGITEFLDVSKLYLLEPEGLTFAAPATVSINVDGTDEDLPARFILNSSGGDVIMTDGQSITYDYDTGQASVSANLNHFSRVWDNLPRNGGIRIRFGGIPSAAPVGNSVFAATATVTQNAASGIRSDAVMLEDAGSTYPIDESNESGDNMGILDADRAQVLTGSKSYDCETADIGAYFGKVTFNLYNLATLFASAGFAIVLENTSPEAVFNALYTSNAKRTIICRDNSPTPTPTPILEDMMPVETPTPEETQEPEPTAEPTSTPENVCDESEKVCQATGDAPGCVLNCRCDDGFPIGSCEATCLDTGANPTQCDPGGVGCPGGAEPVCPG